MKEHMCTHLTKVPGSSSYYFRRKIPLDLIGHYKKAEIKKSLRTSDRREAERLARIEGTKFDNEFAMLRAENPDESTVSKPTIPYPVANSAIEGAIVDYEEAMQARNEAGREAVKGIALPIEGDVSHAAYRYLVSLRAQRDVAAKTGWYEEYIDFVKGQLRAREEILKSGQGSVEAYDEPLWKTEAMRNAYRALLNGEGPAAWIAAVDLHRKLTHFAA